MSSSNDINTELDLISKLSDQIIGLTVDDASELLKKDGYIIRIVDQENEGPFWVTCDFMFDRINVVLDKDCLISKIDGLG